MTKQSNKLTPTQKLAEAIVEYRSAYNLSSTSSLSWAQNRKLLLYLTHPYACAAWLSEFIKYCDQKLSHNNSLQEPLELVSRYLSDTFKKQMIVTKLSMPKLTEKIKKLDICPELLFNSLDTIHKETNEPIYIDDNFLIKFTKNHHNAITANKIKNHISNTDNCATSQFINIISKHDKKLDRAILAKTVKNLSSKQKESFETLIQRPSFKRFIFPNRTLFNGELPIEIGTLSLPNKESRSIYLHISISTKNIKTMLENSEILLIFSNTLSAKNFAYYQSYDSEFNSIKTTELDNIRRFDVMNIYLMRNGLSLFLDQISQMIENNENLNTIKIEDIAKLEEGIHYRLKQRHTYFPSIDDHMLIVKKYIEKCRDATYR